MPSGSSRRLTATIPSVWRKPVASSDVLKLEFLSCWVWASAARVSDVVLEAWERASVSGRLLIAGKIGEDLEQAYAHVLARPDVQQLGYVQNIAQVYAAADVPFFLRMKKGGNR